MRQQAADDQHTLHELETMYALESTVRDIYVEGPTDAALVDWYLRQHSRRWRVRTIDAIYIPRNDLLRAGLEDGNKGRVVFAGGILGANPAIAKQCLFVADRDADYVLGKSAPSREGVLYTDYASLELYGFATHPLDKLLRVVLRVRERVTAGMVIGALTNALVEIGLVRAALHELEAGQPLIRNFTRCCLGQGEATVRVDMNDLIQRSVQGRGIQEHVSSRVEELRNIVPDDKRLAIHGHDCAKLLSWWLQPLVRGENRLGPDVLERMLLGCLDREYLDEQPLFRNLLRLTSEP